MEDAHKDVVARQEHPVKGVSKQTTVSKRPPKDTYSRKGKKQDKIKQAKSSPWGGEGPTIGSHGVTQPFTVERILSDWDRMLLAKYVPGEVEAPYCAGQNILPVPTGTFKKSIAFSTAVAADVSIDGARVQMGTSDFTIFAYCPVVTSHVGTGTIAGQRLGGLQVMQVNNQGTSVLYQDGFNRATRAYTCLDLYGSDFGGFAQAGMIWAAELEISLLAPLANLVGAVYEGALTMSQIPSGGLSIGQLIGLSQRTHTGGSLFSLKGAVVNHNMIFDAFGSTTPSDVTPFVDLSLETVHFLVFQTPVISITTGTRANFSFIGSVKGNYLFWPKATDPLANRLGQKSTQADSYVDSQTVSFSTPQTVAWYDPLVSVGKDLISAAIDNFAPGVVKMAIPKARELFHAVTGGKGIMSKMGQSLGSALAKSHVMRSVEVHQPYITKVTAIYTLSNLREACKEWLVEEDNVWIREILDHVDQLEPWYETLPDTFPVDTQRAVEKRATSLERKK